MTDPSAPAWEETRLFQSGVFTLASGQQSDWKIECDALADEDWATLAIMLLEQLPAFGEVEGVPRGGLPLADALRPYGYIRGGGPLLIVDDVWTTGQSMRRHMDGRHAIAAVVFARGPVDSWVTALFQMKACTHV